MDSSPAAGRTPVRLAILNSHPIQYFAPLYRRLAQERDIDLTVLYCSLQGAKAYRDQGFQTEVRWDLPLLEGYRWKLLPNLRRRDHVGGFWSLVNPAVILALRRGRYDALWVHGHGYATHVLALVTARLAGIPVLMRGETHLGLRRSGLRRWLRRLLMPLLYRRLCSVCMAIGARNREFYRSLGVPDERIVLVPYTVDNDRFGAAAARERSRGRPLRVELRIAAETPVVLFAARLTPRKRPLDLLRAYAALREQGIEAALLVAGSGEEETRLRAYARTHAVPDVVFLGFRNQASLPAVYAASDVFVLPSEDEPWGLTINEAMACGLPVVTAAEIGAVPDLVRHGETGVVFRTGDGESLRRALERLVTDPEGRRAMGRKARRMVEGWGLAETVHGVHVALARARGAEW